MSARLMLLLVLMLTSLPADADPVTDLYAADVAVVDQDAATRTSALKDALAQVLVKVTGSESVLQTEAARDLLQNPARLLQQYRYTPAPAPTEPGAPRLLLHTEFDGRVIEQRLRAAGLPLWGHERPLTLAWVALNDNIDRQLFGANDTASPIAALRRAAERRGLPLQLPRMDQEDATRVSFMDVWGVFEEPLLDAARRYSPDAVLAGSVFRAGDDLWAGRWTLLRENTRQRWETSGSTAEAVVVNAIDGLAEHYAREFAVGVSIEGDAAVRMEIEDVDDLDAYARVQEYLAGLSVVKKVRLIAVVGSQLRLALELNGDARALEQAIRLGRVLERIHGGNEVIVPLGETSAGAPVTAEPALRYRYRR